MSITCQDGVHTFHRLHKDLLFFTGVLFIHQHAVEDAAECACQTQNTLFFKKRRRRGTAGGNTCQDPNVTSLTGRHAWLICGERWTAFCFKCFVSEGDEAVSSYVSEKRAERRDPGDSGGAFNTENNEEKQ